MAKVHKRIVCGILHCLPSAEKHLRADSGFMHYDELLSKLTLRDLYSGRLQTYVFNLPRSIMSDVKVYRNDCVIGMRAMIVDQGQSRWVAGFRKMPTLSTPQAEKEEGLNVGASTPIANRILGSYGSTQT